MSKEDAIRLRAAREHAGLTQGKLAKAAGVSQSTIGNIEAGTRGFGASVLRLAEVCGVRPQWLANNEGEMLTTSVGEPLVKYVTEKRAESPSSKANLIFAGSVASYQKIQVAGMARLGKDGFFEEIEGGALQGTGTVEALSEDPAAYALCIKGDAGFPAIRDGYYIVVEPHLTAQPSELVVVVLTDGSTLLQELLIDKPESITTVSLDGQTRRTIPRAEIRSQFGIQPVTHIVSPRKWSPNPQT
jgi:phage repressor protein C with HTH and peptisase S24 domain